MHNVQHPTPHLRTRLVSTPTRTGLRSLPFFILVLFAIPFFLYLGRSDRDTRHAATTRQQPQPQQHHKKPARALTLTQGQVVEEVGELSSAPRALEAIVQLPLVPLHHDVEEAALLAGGKGHVVPMHDLRGAKKRERVRGGRDRKGEREREHISRFIFSSGLCMMHARSLKNVAPKPRTIERGGA